MAVIDENWLNERGQLHDARIVGVRVERDQVTVVIDDEWSNERDAKDGASAGLIRLSGARLVAGSLTDVGGGWISEICFAPDGLLHFDFCDREPVVFEVGAAEWEAIPQIKTPSKAPSAP